MRPYLSALVRMIAMCLTVLGLQTETAVMAQSIPTSRSGIVLFTMAPDRVRVEESGYTMLKSIGFDGYDILIRSPFETTGTATQAVEMHAHWLASFYRVQPASAPVTLRHPGGFDVAIRSFFIGGANGGPTFTVVAALQGGSKATVVEFVASAAQSPQAVQKMLAFLQGCLLAHMQMAASGPPPLTVYDLESTLDLLESLLDTSLTVAQREVVRANILEGWRRRDAETFNEVRQFIELRDQLAQFPPTRANMVRRLVEQELTAALRKETSPVATLLVRAYDTAHPAIAAGVPPLTRAQADAALELFYFMAAQLEGVTASPSAGAKAAWATGLAQSWRTLPLDTRNAIVGMPATWALTQAVWPELTVDVRQQIIATYATSDVVRVLRADLVTARNQLRTNRPSFPPAQHGMATTAAAASSPSATDVSEQIAKMNHNYQATSSMLTSGYNATISMMAGIGNWSGSRYTVK